MNTGMECDCSNNYCDWDEGPEAFSVSFPRARKEHRCCECEDTIPIGVKYERVWGIWDDEMDTFKTCEVCAQIRNDYGCCASYGHLREAIRDSLYVDYITGEILPEPFLKSWVEETTKEI